MKKITKFLDSVMGGIKRTCIAKAVAVFAVASIAINANAQTTNEQGVITGIDQLDGISQKDLLGNAITFTTDKDLKFPTDSKYHFFLYNVKTGRFLNAGGYWGTHASLKEYGEPIAIVNSGTTSFGQHSQTIKLVMEMHGTEGKFVGHYGAYNQTNPDRGVYVDRKSDDVFGWVLEPAPGKDKNTYRLYTYCADTDGKTDWNTITKYYLCSNKGLVDVDRNCEAYPESSLSEYAGYDEWRFISYDQIHNLQKQNGDNLTDALELSFKLKCPGFSRGDNDITSWHTYNFNTGKSDVTGFTDGFALYGLSKYYNYIAGSETKPSEKEEDQPTWQNKLSYTAYEFEGNKYYNSKDDFDNYRRNLGKYYCASITNKRGIVYQNVEVTMTGTYKIECNGYSTTNKAALFAGVIDPANPNKMLNKSLNKTILNQTGDMSQTVQNELQISEKNMDYAGKSFYSGNYSNAVYVTVPEAAFNKVTGKATIRFGIMVGEFKTDTNAEDGEWTVFDKFHMLYASRTFEEDLILDEHRDNLKYLLDLKPMKTKTLRLKKDFTLNKWNSFILPVNLTKKQVTETFGASARLAELTELTETGIEFTSVNLDNNKETALKAYVPYLIFPTKGADQTKAYTAKYAQNATNTRLLVNIADNHYVIDKVSMKLTEDGKKYDFSDMDQKHWTTTVTGGNKDIKAYGTFARTFGTEQEENTNDGTYTWTNDGSIIKDRETLVDCYFFDKGNMYHSAKRPRGLRGFSCWFKIAPGAQRTLKFTLDGVSQGTTGIEDILADYEQPVSRFANGIYNLNGQLVKQGNSTAGLPSGMYIVNGKKCIVR